MTSLQLIEHPGNSRETDLLIYQSKYWHRRHINTQHKKTIYTIKQTIDIKKEDTEHIEQWKKRCMLARLYGSF